MPIEISYKEKSKESGSEGKKKWRGKSGGAGSGAYFVAFIGATVYYLQHATSFWDGVLGILKACVWPALLVHKLLGFLQM